MIPLFKVFMSPDAKRLVGQTLDSGYIGEGPAVVAFEAAFSSLVGVPRVLATNSCTSAIALALHLLNIGPGDEVISTPMTCLATNMPILHRGAAIVWADVDENGLISADDVQRKITPRTKAIMAVDWAGQVPDCRRLRSFGLPIIQDAAHSLLGPVYGDYVCWSFQAIKHLTTGDGGALMVPEAQRERARLLRWFGLDRNSSASYRCEQRVPEAGFKYHMNDIAATIGLANMPFARELVRRHQTNADYYNVCFGIRHRKSSHWIYPIRVKDRPRLIAHLKAAGIEAGQVHARNDTQPCFAAFKAPLSGVDAYDSENVAIPVGWWLTPEQRTAIADAVLSSNAI